MQKRSGEMTVNDTYTEDLVAVEANQKTMMTKIGIIALAIILSLGIVLLIPKLLFLIIVVIVLAGFLWQYTKVEYEYTFLSPDFDVDKIFNQNKRKNVFSVSFKDIELVAPYGDQRLERYLGGKVAQTLDFSSGNEKHERYSVIISQNGSVTHMIIEPSQKTLQLFKMTAPQKVYLS